MHSGLLEEAGVLGLDPADIDAFADQVGSPPSDSDSSVLTGTNAQAPATYVEARYSNLGGGWTLTSSFTFPDPA